MNARRRLLRRAPLDAEPREPVGNRLTVRGGADLPVDVEDLAVGADIERPTGGEGLPFRHHAVCRGGFTLGIAEDREIDAELLREPPVGVRLVDARGEVRDVESANGAAALPERLALCRSTAGESLGKPHEDDRLPAPIVG